MKTKLLLSLAILFTNFNSAKAYNNEYQLQGLYNKRDADYVQVRSVDWKNGSTTTGNLYSDGSGGFYGQTYNWRTGQSDNVRIYDYGTGDLYIRENF